MQRGGRREDHSAQHAHTIGDLPGMSRMLSNLPSDLTRESRGSARALHTNVNTSKVRRSGRPLCPGRMTSLEPRASLTPAVAPCTHRTPVLSHREAGWWYTQGGGGRVYIQGGVPTHHGRVAYTRIYPPSHLPREASLLRVNPLS